MLSRQLVAITHTSTAAFAVDAASFAVSALSLALIPRRAAAGSLTGGDAEAAGHVEAAEGGGADGMDGAGGGARDGHASAEDGAKDGQDAAKDGAAAKDRAGDGARDGVLALLRRTRALQVILVVVIAANLVSGGMGDVALPSLAHARFGAAGYGALLACLAAGGVIGTLGAARTGGLRRPVLFAGVVFLIQAVSIGLVPYLGGEAGAAAALFVVGGCNGLGNVTFLTLVQKWVSPGLLGRLMGTIMLCAFGMFPLSVAISGVLVHHLGATVFFPAAGAVVAVAILGGLTQREFRDFGAIGSASDTGTPARVASTRAGE
jgi:hypothetical protein